MNSPGCRFLLAFSKLETDPLLLIPKAHAALERYGHQVVIGNDLHRRKFEVVFVSRNAQPDGIASTGKPHEVTSTFVEHWLRIDLARDPSKEIEEDIISELVRRHEEWVKKKQIV